MRTSSLPTIRTFQVRFRYVFETAKIHFQNVSHYATEYVPKAYQRRAFLTDFTGSAGTAVVTKEEALLWADSRYWNEASLKLDADSWHLQKQGHSDTPTITAWLSESLKKENPRIGVDPYVTSAHFRTELSEAFDKKEYTLDAIMDTNLVDELWSSDRPPVPKSPFRVHPIEYAGLSTTDKITQVRDKMQEEEAGLAVFSALDEVAYLLNVRAQGDIETCPVGIAYVTVSTDSVVLYCDKEKLLDIEDHLRESGITWKPYEDVVADVAAFAAGDADRKVWMDLKRSNLALGTCVESESQIVDKPSALTVMKACKNEAELEGMRKAHILDGVAMAHFIPWLETTLKERSVSEVEVDEKLTGYRAEQEGFLECSFPTIAGVGSNGAIVHYRAAEDSELLQHLDHSQPILIDSGGQYVFGTTDVTRTWHFGTATDEFRECYTRVLQGHIGVDTMQFPVDTPGFVLDVMARKALWTIGKDYGHGTGHGVGAALNVHEGPHSISPRWSNTEGLKAGMIVSNEPGFYKDGDFGIRIENLLEIETVEGTPVREGDKEFLRFRPLTLMPIQKNLIKVELLTESEIKWVDSYHKRVLSTIGPLLPKDSPAKEWLERSCAPLEPV